MNSLFIDTSGWLCLLDRNEPYHMETDLVYQQAYADGRIFVTSNYVLSELVALVSSRSRLPRDRVWALRERILSSTNTEIVYIDRALDGVAWQMLKTHDDKGWSLTDASSFVIMTERGIQEALTTDKHFIQAGFIRLPLGQ